MEESINLSAWLGCNVKQAFKMFINKKHLHSWLPAVLNVEPGVGGKFKISWTKKNRNGKKNKINKKKSLRAIFRCKILAYKSNKYIAFEWKSPADIASKNHSQFKTQVVVYFRPMDIKKTSQDEFTEVHLILTGLESSSEDSEARNWFENTWADAFAKLIEYVNDTYQ